MDSSNRASRESTTKMIDSDKGECPICDASYATRDLEAHVIACLDAMETREAIAQMDQEQLVQLVGIGGEDGEDPTMDARALLVSQVVQLDSCSAAAPPDVVDKECLICLDTKPSREFSSFPCSHSYCKECLAAQIEVLVNSGRAASVNCCYPNCRYILTDYEIQTLAGSSEVYERYKVFADISLKNKDPKTRWCPTPDCGTGVTIVGENLRCKLDCEKCGKAFCAGCSQQHDPEKTSCKKARRKALRKNKGEKQAHNWASKNTQDCPGCGDHIERAGGCHTMRCTRCNTVFCYHCGKRCGAGQKHCVGSRLWKGVGGALALPPIIIIGTGMVVPGLVLAVPVGVPVAAAVGIPSYGIYRAQHAVKEYKKKKLIAAGNYHAPPPVDRGKQIGTFAAKPIEYAFNQWLLVMGIDQA